MDRKAHVDKVRAEHGCKTKPMPMGKTVSVKGHYRTMKDRK